ncbi:molybdenum cofactor guanylyltransferase [Alkalihalobacillus sp. MEB130]|uniref:molybdenum cofactor guanylyltransferase n=1 Tax=Alkalihalobacillus sp. MEB130 TaxID=2976704 RepID=UPI0028DDCC58|nr:molybdenum cofactor guanylyltransferase [Alkalihalobacillus sp. MEB130]MDT8861274.1 molybdenum cofactor guanylyltransferase [Alkalihalobacillus sp. MEB130]
MQLTGVILDSESYKIDQDRLISLLKLGEQTIIERQVMEMKKICDEVILVTNNPFVYLPLFGNSIRIITDYFKGAGTLSGMHAALSLAKNQSLWLVTSDMPLLNSEVILDMLELKNKTGVQVIAPEFNGNLQLYHGVYDRTCLNVTKELVEKEEQGLMKILEKVSFKVLTLDHVHDQVKKKIFSMRIQTEEDYEKVVQDTKDHAY